MEVIQFGGNTSIARVNVADQLERLRKSQDKRNVSLIEPCSISFWHISSLISLLSLFFLLNNTNNSWNSKQTMFSLCPGRVCFWISFFFFCSASAKEFETRFLGKSMAINKWFLNVSYPVRMSLYISNAWRVVNYSFAWCFEPRAMWCLV